MKLTEIFVLKLFKRRSSGYIAILLCIAIPILLYSVKYALDKSTQYDTALVSDVDVNKRDVKCAREVALAVARNWNPGLTLTQQRDAVMKIADVVYNDNARLCGTVVGNAIPGLDIKTDYKIVSNPTFNGMVVKPQTVVSAIALVQYENITKYVKRQGHYHNSGIYSAWNPSYAMWRAIDKGTDAARRISIFDEVDEDLLRKGVYSLKHHDIYTTPLITQGYMTSSFPKNEFYGDKSSYFYLTLPVKTNSTSSNYSPASTLAYKVTSYSTGTSTYKRRVTPLDPYCVQVSISGDRIMARTGSSNIGYASPAQCNVDIILAIPTNAAANNGNNRDAASDVAEEPSYSSTAASTAIATWVKNTPIYQIGQACKNFVKNFYHTRGVNMGLIPYSAKVSISPDKISYASTIPAFMRSNITGNECPVFNKIRGACLYGATGIKDYSLLENNYNWNTNLTGCPIMCRRGTANSITDYGGNYLYNGLFTYSNPNSDGYKFRRMNLAPCYLGYANLISFKCDVTCTTFLPNPYYMIEFTADLPKIYELCNALYPIYDPNSVSNFVFIPVEWANNFFQSWTTNTTASATSDQLSRPSKMTAGRKKALILIVNKPDWFEPGELTYLGFHNDYAELPMVESDKIRFDINYNDSTKKFIDGTAYNGTIQGQKKILKCSGSLTMNSSSGFYECTSGNVRLSFPQKMPLKLVVKPRIASMVTFYGDNGVDTCKLGSASGNNVPLNVPYLISGSSQTFVFPGRGTNLGDGYTSSFITTMGNFSHNLTPYKVRYDLSNCSISNVVLKNQVIRNYFGALGETTSSAKPAKTLILNDGTLSDWTGYRSASATYINYRYCPDVEGNSKAKSIITGLHCDACMTRYICDYTAWTIPSMNASSCDIYIYGLQKCNIYQYLGSNNTVTLTYYASGGNQQHTITRMSSPIQFSQQSAESDSVHFSLACDAGAYMGLSLTYSLFHNPDDKTFKANITDGDIDNNSYVGLQKLSSPVNAIPAGNYIVFQGEGELHVTVSSSNTVLDGNSDLTFTNVSGDSGKHSITTEQTFWIEPSQISDSKINGEYYIDMDLNNVRLVSAEISNRNILSEEVLDHDETAKIDFSAGQTSSPSLSGFYFGGGLSASGSKTLYLPSNKRGTVSITVKEKPAVSVSWEKVGKLIGNFPSVGLPSTDNWQSICYDGLNSRLIAIGKGGTVVYSTDGGIQWGKIGNLPSVSSTSEYWISVCYDDKYKRLLALNTSGNIAESKDGGRAWKLIENQQGLSPSKLAVSWKCICYCAETANDPAFLMVIGTSKSANSPDQYCKANDEVTLDWSSKYFPSNSGVNGRGWYSMCYIKKHNTLIILNYDGHIIVNKDRGQNLQQSSSPVSATNKQKWYYICCDTENDYVFALNDSGLASVSMAAGPFENMASSLMQIANSGWQFMVYDVKNERLIALNYDQKGIFNKLAYSDDGGRTWNLPEKSPLDLSNWHAMCFDNSKKRIIALNVDGTIAATTDNGENWTIIGCKGMLSDFCKVNQWDNIFCINNLIALSDDAYIVCSDDGGETWSSSESIKNIEPWGWFTGGYYNNNYVLMNVYYGTICISNDGKGKNWNRVCESVSDSYSYYGICYDSGNGIFIRTKQIYKNGTPSVTVENSNNGGATWKSADVTQLTSINNSSWYCIDYNSKYKFAIAISYKGKVAYSSNGGVNWDALSSLNSISSNGWYSICRDINGNGLLALNENGTVAHGTVTIPASTFQFTCGSDTAVKTVTGTQTFNIDASSLSSVTFSISNAELVSATLQFPIYRTEIKWEDPSYPDDTSRGINWTNPMISKPGYMYFDGKHTYNPIRNRHSLHYSNNSYLNIAAQKYHGDISGIFEEYLSTLFVGTMCFYGNPNINYLGYNNYGVGIIRGFRKYTRRDTGTLGYMHIDVKNDEFKSIADVVATEITMPYNTVLYKNNYQKLNDVSTLTESKAVSDLTRAQCTGLKQAYGNNLRIYVIKYRKQEKYKTFPFYQSTQSDADHDYSAVDSCASSSAYLYDISTEAALKNALTAIEQDIKTFAGYTAAKNVN